MRRSLAFSRYLLPMCWASSTLVAQKAALLCAPHPEPIFVVITFETAQGIVLCVVAVQHLSICRSYLGLLWLERLKSCAAVLVKNCCVAWQGRHWVLDPIDGTRGFVGMRQYAVCLGLLDKGQVIGA